MKLVQDQWETFARRVMPVGVSAVQYKEMRRAFYSGVEAHLKIMTKILGPGQEPTESDMQIMDGILKELEDFAADIASGRA